MISSPRGAHTSVGVDRIGAPVSIYEAIPGRTAFFLRDIYSRIWRIQDFRGNILDLTYDTTNNVIRTVDATTSRKDTVTYWKQTMAGFEVTVGPLDVRNNVGDVQPSFRYDSVYLKTSWLYPDSLSSITRYAMLSDGRLDSIIDPAGHITKFRYGATGRQNLDSVRAGVNREQFTRDGHGRITHVSRSDAQPQGVAYDSRNRVTKTWSIGNDTVRFVYNGRDMTQVISPRGDTTRFAYNGVGWDTAHTDPYGRIEQYLYDRDGNLGQYTNRRGDTVKFQYDTIGRIVSRTAPGIGTTTFKHTYNDAWVVGSNGASSDSLVFDLASRMIHAYSKRGSTTYRLDWTYDAASRSKQLSMGTPFSKTIAQWSYDVFGQVDTLTDGGGLKTIFRYNPDRLAYEIVLPTTTPITESVTYPSSHRESSISFNQTTLNARAGRFIKQDSTGRIIEVWNAARDTLRKYGYNDRGWLESFTISVITSPQTPCSIDPNFGSNCVGADTTEVFSRIWSYDAAGNSQLEAGAPDSIGRANRAIILLTEFGNIDTLVYDADGNLDTLRSHTPPFGAIKQVFYWNAISQLDSIKTYNSGALHNTARMRYDAFGRRVWHVMHNDTVHSIWDGPVNVAEVDTTDALRAVYSYYPGSLTPHAMNRLTSTYYQIQDEMGTVGTVLHNSGTVSVTRRCNPWGGGPCQTIGTEPIAFGLFGFKGQYEDASNATVYMRNRYYYPSLRRFISEDPLGLSGGLNVYAFAENDPVNGGDPFGLQPRVCRREPNPPPGTPECETRTQPPRLPRSGWMNERDLPVGFIPFIGQSSRAIATRQLQRCPAPLDASTVRSAAANAWFTTVISGGREQGGHLFSRGIFGYSYRPDLTGARTGRSLVLIPAPGADLGLHTHPNTSTFLRFSELDSVWAVHYKIPLIAVGERSWGILHPGTTGVACPR